MVTEVLLFVGGALVGLFLRRNEIATDARVKAMEHLIDFRVMVDMWPEDGVPMEQDPERDREVRILLERLSLWLTAAGVSDPVTHYLCESADTVWRGFPRETIIQEREAEPGALDLDVYREVMNMSAAVAELQFLARDSGSPRLWCDSDGLVGHRLSTSVSTTGTAVGSSVDEI